MIFKTNKQTNPQKKSPEQQMTQSWVGFLLHILYVLIWLGKCRAVIRSSLLAIRRINTGKCDKWISSVHYGSMTVCGNFLISLTLCTKVEGKGNAFSSFSSSLSWLKVCKMYCQESQIRCSYLKQKPVFFDCTDSK